MKAIDVSTRSTGLPYKIFLADKPESKTAPIMLCLDGDDQFSPALEAYNELRAAGKVRALTLVGVGYGVSYVNVGKPGNRRLQDYTPTAMPGEEGSGGGPAFLAWLRGELFPWLEREQGLAARERGIMGHSLGSLFGLYSFFSDNSLFSACLASAPSLWYHDRNLLGFISDQQRRLPTRPGRLFVGIGENDTESMLADVATLEEQLRAKPIASLEVQGRRFPGRDHYDLIPESFRAGLAALYPAEADRLEP
jgi:hypothetical protein